MKAARNRVSLYAVAVLTVFALSASVRGQSTNSSPGFAAIRISNFGRIDENYFRGAQPGTADYKSLARIGVKTVIDLTSQGLRP